MKWTGLNELRELYLSFFESKDHLRLPSFSLIPNNDKSLLLINSGMAPMKKYFTGEVTPPHKRVTTCQKCIRTPDIDRVGITARHGTYFEMLGNFSFGDYFKKEATAWAWEFLIKVLEIPEDRLYCSVYENDDEAAEIWEKEVGVDPTHIVRLGKEDNFWEHGQGPCGPCSEIYFDRGPEYGCGKPTCGVGCDCDRYMEVWNNVFSQFNNDGHGNYTELAQKNIDTGMGLERLACVMQGVDNLFLVDTVQNIMKHISRIAGVAYGTNEKDDISLRVITDHIRSTTFMIGDGVMPSNEGRGYVLRRLLRRAARHGKILGINHPFLAEVCETVISENEGAYPELREKEEFIKNVIRYEEENFNKTIDQGLSILNSLIEKIDQSELKMLSGDDAFKLNDTFGFPLDLTKEILAERGIGVEEERFHELMSQQRTRARNSRKQSDTDAWAGSADVLEDVPATKFLGYETTQGTGRIVAIVRDGERVESVSAGEEAVLILDQTTFYAESGGQVGDSGYLEGDDVRIRIGDCKKTTDGKFMHMATVETGTAQVGTCVQTCLDEERHRAIMRNHTAAHLLQAALRQVLGDHVHQAGSYVDEFRVRFDFSHFSALTPEELMKVEKIVNEEILKGVAVQRTSMPIEEAKKLGAIALFGEKYGDVVRVVNVPGYSVEFCGGTHVDNTAKLGLFKIISESSVAAGVRRIEGTTGFGVLELLEQADQAVHNAAMAMKLSNAAEMPAKVEALVEENKAKDKTIESLRSEIAGYQIDGMFKNAVEVEGISIITASFSGTGTDALKVMGDQAKDKAPGAVIALAGTANGKTSILVACGKDAVARGMHAGKIVREVVAVTGGKGGGRPDTAMGGVGDPMKVDEALAHVENVVRAMVKS